MFKHLRVEKLALGPGDRMCAVAAVSPSAALFFPGWMARHLGLAVGDKGGRLYYVPDGAELPFLTPGTHHARLRLDGKQRAYRNLEIYEEGRWLFNGHLNLAECAGLFGTYEEGQEVEVLVVTRAQLQPEDREPLGTDTLDLIRQEMEKAKAGLERAEAELFAGGDPITAAGHLAEAQDRAGGLSFLLKEALVTEARTRGAVTPLTELTKPVAPRPLNEGTGARHDA